MIRTLLLAVAIATALSASPATAHDPAAPAAHQNEASRELHRFFEQEWERSLRESPENASYRGDRRYNDRWTDLGLEAIRAREAADRAALQRLKAIDRSRLDPADQLNYDVFAWQLERDVERQKYREYLRPLSQRGGVQTADEITEVLPFADVRDYRDWLKRLDALPTLVEQTAVLLREGLRAGNTPPRVLMERVPAQIAAQVVGDPAASPFYKPFRRMPDSIPAAEQEALRGEARRLIAGRVVPGRYSSLKNSPNVR
jgi:uncharacterized protein (DUF885 family)